MKSTHRIEVVDVKLEKHPNADSLSIVKLFGGGYQVVVRSSDWKDGDRGAYIPPDTLVPIDRPEFAFLRERPESPKLVNGREYHRLKAVKLRKEYSMGMLVPVPAGADESDLMKHFEAIHYEPPDKNTSRQTTYGSQSEPAPSSKPPSYDVDSIRRYSEVFTVGEPVVITEKIHGANARYTYEDRGAFGVSIARHSASIRIGSKVLTWSRGHGTRVKTLPSSSRYMRVGSRSQWKKPDPTDIWWRALTPEMSRFCRMHPDKVLYGEVYGDVQDLDYGLPAGEVRFVAFDALVSSTRAFLDYPVFLALMKRYGIPTVPLLGLNVPYTLGTVLDMAEGQSCLAKHVREGVVVRPLRERHDPRIGRVILKAVGNGYLERG